MSGILPKIIHQVIGQTNIGICVLTPVPRKIKDIPKLSLPYNTIHNKKIDIVGVLHNLTERIKWKLEQFDGEDKVEAKTI